MVFASLFEIYEADKRKRVRESILKFKIHVICTNILTCFGEKKIAEI